MTDKIVIQEVIVVEGKNDIAAVKRAVDAEMIITNGFMLSKATLKDIKAARDRCGVIVLTDPDTVGEKIRKRINAAVSGCKHAFLPREDAVKNGDVGIENANPATIQAALTKVHTLVSEKNQTFSMADLVANGLTGQELAAERRARLGKILGLGYTNSKQFLNRLNHYGIRKEEFLAACSAAGEPER